MAHTARINSSLWPLKKEKTGLRNFLLKTFFYFLPQIFWEFVDHGGDEAFHGAELGVQTEEHQHEEEAAGPERREGHLQHGTRVGEEGKAGALKNIMMERW